MNSDMKMNINSIEGQMLNQVPTPVMTIDKEYNITFMNRSGCSFVNLPSNKVIGTKCYDVFNSKKCKTEDCVMKAAIEKGEVAIFENEIDVNGSNRHFECNVSPLLNEQEEIIGGVETIVDVTQRVLDDKKLREQSQAIREMSTPTIKLWEGILVLPVIGVIDSVRAQYMMESILNKILETSSKVIILDIHGVAAVDTAVANHLIKITKATKLMGCECLLSGISPAVAQTIIQLGINMSTIKTSSNLSDALKRAFSISSLEVKTSEG